MHRCNNCMQCNATVWTILKNAPVTGAFNKRDRSHPVDDANRVGADLNPLFGSAQREKPSVRANPFGGVPLGVERKGGVWIRQ